MKAHNNKKRCYHCKKIRYTSEFHKNKKKPDGFHDACKKCRKTLSKCYYSKYAYKISVRAKQKRNITSEIHLLRGIKQRCNNINSNVYHRYGGRGIKCLITTKEIRQIMERDNYWGMIQPSIDRIDNDGNYEYNNCRFIEFKENNIKDKKRIVLQYDLEGNFIKEWESIRCASERLNVCRSKISTVCQNKRHQTGGFKWRYKNDRQ